MVVEWINKKHGNLYFPFYTTRLYTAVIVHSTRVFSNKIVVKFHCVCSSKVSCWTNSILYRLRYIGCRLIFVDSLNDDASLSIYFFQIKLKYCVASLFIFIFRLTDRFTRRISSATVVLRRRHPRRLRNMVRHHFPLSCKNTMTFCNIR